MGAESDDDDENDHTHGTLGTLLSLSWRRKKRDFESVLLEHRRKKKKKKKKNDRARAAKRSAQSAFDDDATRGVDGASPSPFLCVQSNRRPDFLAPDWEHKMPV